MADCRGGNQLSEFYTDWSSDQASDALDGREMSKLDTVFNPLVDELSSFLRVLHFQGCVTWIISVDASDTEQLKLLSNCTDTKLSGLILERIGKRLQEDETKVSSSLIKGTVQ